MGVLIDTHAFLWWCEDAAELSRKARAVLASQDCYISVASFWEMALKINLGKLRLPAPIENYVPEQMSLNGFEELPIHFRHVSRTAMLPRHHGDPFDRILVAQCQEEKLSVLSRDSAFDLYGIKRIW